jgi:hypothetical protein
MTRRGFFQKLFAAAAAVVLAPYTKAMAAAEAVAEPVTEWLTGGGATPGYGAPRCDRCFAAWGQCPHTGGPMDTDPLDRVRFDQLDQRVRDCL